MTHGPTTPTPPAAAGALLRAALLILALAGPALAQPSTPTAVVQALLASHLAGDMALTRASLAPKAAWLTPALQARLERWLALPQDPDEAPDINGDPFSNTQEYPSAFSLAPARVQGHRAELTATFTGAGIRPSRVTLLLRRAGGEWRVDDLRYPDGSRLTQLLGGPAPVATPQPGRTTP